MIVEKRWQVFPDNPAVSEQLAHALNMSPVVAQLLLNRNIRSLKEARSFMEDRADLIQGFDDQTMGDVIGLVKAAVQNKTKILLYGDYDVDGMTSVTQMMSFLKLLGANVTFFIPSRFTDGYGLNMSVVDRILSDDIGLLITLDCGVTSVEEISAIKSRTSAKVIVMDHHTIPDEPPPFDAMLNPKAYEETHDLYWLCTAGIVYEFIRCYVNAESLEIDTDQYLDVVALGTIADIAPLKGANRVYTKLGLEMLSKRYRLGVKHLLDASGFDRSVVSPRDVGFVIGPRLNAAGRLAHAGLGVQLLMSEDEEEAKHLAFKLDKMNQDRRQINTEMLAECLTKVQQEVTDDDRIVVLSERGWHSGVIGIVAAKLVEHTGRPVVMIADDGEIGRASARSVGTVSIYKVLKSCQSFFEDFGGHKEAAGFSIKPDQIDAFKDAVRQKAKTMISADDLRPVLTIDGYLSSEEISIPFIEELGQLEPFGQGNSQPVFYSSDFVAVDYRAVGDGSHLKVTFRDKTGKMVIDGIGFNLSSKLSMLNKSEVSVAFHLDINEWQGRVRPQLQLVDIK